MENNIKAGQGGWRAAWRGGAVPGVGRWVIIAGLAVVLAGWMLAQAGCVAATVGAAGAGAAYVHHKRHACYDDYKADVEAHNARRQAENQPVEPVLTFREWKAAQRSQKR